MTMPPTALCLAAMGLFVSCQQPKVNAVKMQSMCRFVYFGYHSVGKAGFCTGDGFKWYPYMRYLIPCKRSRVMI